jgi:hypothetical protein
MHVTGPTPENHAKALQTIAAVKVLKIDPARSGWAVGEVVEAARRNGTRHPGPDRLRDPARSLA